MASIIGTKNGPVLRSRPRSRTVEEIEISAGWVEDQNNHYLLVDLPGFKKEEVKIDTDRIDEVTISGERQEMENKFLYFERKFKVPANSEIWNTSGMLEDGILTVTLPKQVKPPVREEPGIQKKEMKENELKKAMQETSGQNHEDGPREDKSEMKKLCEESKEMLQKLEDDKSLLKSALKALKHNKGLILTVVISFSLGVLVSHEFDISSREIVARTSQP